MTLFPFKTFFVFRHVDFSNILVEDKDLKEFGKFKPYRSVPSSDGRKPEYAVDGSIGEREREREGVTLAYL